MKAALEKVLADALTSLGISDAKPVVEHTDLAHGDYASGAALQYAKQAGIAPRALAEKLVVTMGAVDGVKNIEIAGPGFINFTVEPSRIWQHLETGRTHGEKWGSGLSGKDRRIMVEYTDPNPFKVFHIGHLMPNVIGESISRLLQFSSAEIYRANYQGDVGPHVAKALWGLKKLGLNAHSAKDLGTAYATGSEAYDSDPAAKAEIEIINAKVYDRSDPEINALYDAGRKASLDHFEEIYVILGTKFDHYFFESETAPRGVALVKAHPEVFEESDGAIVYKGEKVGLHTRVFLTSKGLPTYEAKDLGLAELKASVWNFDTSITVTAHEQAEYFKVVLAAMKEVLPDEAKKILHVTHGMMRFADGKMSSRKGNVVTGESLLEDLTEAAKARAAESRATDKNKLAQEVAVAAVKFQILKGGSAKDIVFDKERALSLEGDSGPYLQYAHARTSAILDKARESGVAAKFDNAQEASDLVRHIYRFYEVVQHAQQKLEPHLVATYLTELASYFNSWYAREQILDGGPLQSHKVAVVDIVRQTLKNGLWLLGIPAPEKM